MEENNTAWKLVSKLPNNLQITILTPIVRQNFGAKICDVNKATWLSATVWTRKKITKLIDII